MKKRQKKSSMELLVFVVCTALLTALQIVLSRWLSIQSWNMKIGFSFIPVVIAARLFGPLGSVLVYGMGDVIGTLLFPTGAYFPGFTLSSVLMGLVYGLFLYKKCTIWKTVAAVAINQSLLSFLLNSYWISFISGSPYVSQLAVRWPQSLVMGAVMIAVISLGAERICAPIEKNILSRVKRPEGSPENPFSGKPA